VNLSDSLSHIFSFKPVPTADYSTRNSLISGRNGQVHSVKAGLLFRKCFSVGLGYNWLGTEFKQAFDPAVPAFQGTVKFRYVSVFAEYSFFKKGPWEATIPLQFGFGTSFLKGPENSVERRSHLGSVILYEPAMKIEYKILNLIGVGGEVGYRLMLKPNQQIDRAFTSPIYVVNFRIIFDELRKKARAYKSKSNE
jgi:hypothetical protein